MTAPTRCPRCESRLPGSLRFCDVCGEELPRLPPIPPRPGTALVRLRRACGYWVEVHRALAEHEPPRELAGRALRSLAEHHALGTASAAQVNEWIHHAVQHPAPLLLAAESLAAGLSPGERENLYRAACALTWQDDGRLSTHERVALRRVAQAMGLDESFQRNLLFQRFGPLAVCEHILEVSRDAPLRALANAHAQARRMRDNQLARSDLSPQERKRLEEEVDQIETAYEQLTTAVGVRYGRGRGPP